MRGSTWATGLLLAPLGANALSLQFDRPYAVVGETLRVSVSSPTPYEYTAFGRLFWTWCYADLEGAYQEQIAPGWNVLELYSNEDSVGQDWADMFRQDSFDDTFGYIEAHVDLHVTLPGTLELDWYDGYSGWKHYSLTSYGTPEYVPNYAPPVPEPSVGLLTAFGLALLAWWKRA